MSSMQQGNKETSKQFRKTILIYTFSTNHITMLLLSTWIKAFVWFVSPILFVTTNFTYKTKFALSVGRFSIVIGSLRGVPCYVIGLSSRGWPITSIQLHFSEPQRQYFSLLSKPYSKMAAILVFFCLLANSPCCLVLKLEIQKNIFL